MAGGPASPAPPQPEPADAPPVTLIAEAPVPKVSQPPYMAQSQHPGQPQQGSPLNQYPYPPQYGQAAGFPRAINPNDKTSGMSIASLILGITGFLFLPACVGLGLGLGALGTVKRTGQPGKGLAIAGIVLSSAWLSFWVLLVIFS